MAFGAFRANPKKPRTLCGSFGVMKSVVVQAAATIALSRELSRG